MLLRAAEVLHATLDVGAQARVLMALAREHSGAGWAALLLHAPAGTLSLRAEAGLAPVGPRTLPLDDGELGCLLRAGEPFAVGGRLRELFARHGLEALAPELWVPLVARGRLWGVLSLGGLPGVPGGEPALTFLRQLARQAAPALAAACAEQDRRVAHGNQERLQHRLALLHEVSRAVASVPELSRLLGMLVERARDAVDAERASLLLLDEATQELVVRLVRGLPEREGEDAILAGQVQCLRLPRGQGAAGRVLQTGMPVRLPNLDHPGLFLPGGRAPVRSLLAVPVSMDGAVVGVLNLCNRRGGGEFTPEDQDLALLLANHVALALSRTGLPDAAVSDPESGLWNRRSTRHYLEAEVRRARRYGTPVSVALARLPGVEHGLDVARLAHRFRHALRDGVDVAGRLAPDRFLAVLPHASMREAWRVAERLSALGERTPLRVGVAELDLEQGEDAEDVLRRAREALVSAHRPGVPPVCLAALPREVPRGVRAPRRSMLEWLSLSPLRARLAALVHAPRPVGPARSPSG